MQYIDILLEAEISKCKAQLCRLETIQPSRESFANLKKRLQSKIDGLISSYTERQKANLITPTHETKIALETNLEAIKARLKIKDNQLELELRKAEQAKEKETKPEKVKEKSK